MKRSNFFVLIMMVVGIGMIVRTFFGGGDSNPSDNEDILRYGTTGFVAEINDTGNVLDTGDVYVDNVDRETKDYIEIRVMMPRYFYNSEWKRFAENLYNEKKVYMKFIFIDDLNQYRDLLYNPEFSEADLFLFPYDRHEKVSIKTFSSEKDIQSYYNQLLSHIANSNQVSFLPFAADPMVMYAISGYSEPNNFGRISEYVSDREPVRALSFPLFFGILDEDFDGEGFTWEYQDIVWYALMHYFKVNKDNQYLEKRIDSNALENYNISDLKTISNIISTPECKYFPSICFQLFNFVGIRFGFLSDEDVVNQYLYNKKSDFSSINKLPMPFYQLESPVRIWGRGLSSSVEDRNILVGLLTFVSEYFKSYDQYNLRNSTLSVFKTDEGKGLLDNEYIGYRGYILESGGDYINTLKGMEDFQDLITYSITAEEYLR